MWHITTECFFLAITEVPQENAFCINSYPNKKISPESAMGKKIFNLNSSCL